MTKAGLFGIGLDTYWAQFDGLLDNLKVETSGGDSEPSG